MTAPVSIEPETSSSRKSGAVRSIPADRAGMLWAAKIWVVLFIAVVGVATYLVSGQLTTQYSSSATVQVSARGSSTISQLDTVSASNELASQITQLVTTSTVENLAVKLLKVSKLSGGISAQTVANQNLVKITVRSPQPAVAQSEAAALATALVSYVSPDTGSAATSYENDIAKRLTTLDAEITSAQNQVQQYQTAAAGRLAGSSAVVSLTNAQASLADLRLRKANILSQAAVDAVFQSPKASVIAAAGTAGKVFPEPLTYTAIAMIIALVLAIETAWLVGRRRLHGAGALPS